MIYLSVVQIDGVWTIKKVYPNGSNVTGNKTGTLWHRANLMTLQERIEEGIYLQVNIIEGQEPEFTDYVRTDIVFNHETAEVIYTEIYEVMPLDYIRGVLKDRAHTTRTYQFHTKVTFEGDDLYLDHYFIEALNAYANLINLGGTLPADLILPRKHGESIPLTEDLIGRLLAFLAVFNNEISKKYVQICADIDAAQTFEDIKLAALWDGQPL